MVVLSKVGRTNSMVLWATWNDLDYSAQEARFWPSIIGEIKMGDVALVLDIHTPQTGPVGAKICVSPNNIGWINCRCLNVLGDPAET